jgi:hypothetical protein
MMLLDEWRPVRHGYPYEINRSGTIRNTRTLKRLKPILNNKGYFAVYLHDGKRREGVGVHRLLAEAFLGECPKDHEVNHKNAIKTDNSLSNLEYVTSLENTRHAFRLGLIRRHGEHNGGAKLTWDDVRMIRELGTWMPRPWLTGLFGVRLNTIRAVLLNLSWRQPACS